MKKLCAGILACVIPLLDIRFAWSQSMDETGLWAHLEPATDVAINPSYRGSRHTLVYSDVVGMTVRIQARHIVGVVDPTDCDSGYLDLGSPAGTESVLNWS